MKNFLEYLKWISIPEFNFTNLFELFLLIIIIYQAVKWVQTTKAWSLLKGIIFLLCFYFFSYTFGLTTFTFIFEKIIGIVAIGLIVIFSPELRKALETLGKKSFSNNKISIIDNKKIYSKFSDKTVDEIIEACQIMSKAKTGALMLFEQNDSLSDYDSTGIIINADITRQLIINIFEHNTPLHDGALTLRNDRIAYGTCYLPLSEAHINKNLGTRHRAALGASEEKDCLVVIVSEETGAISVCQNGKIEHNISQKELRKKLEKAQMKVVEDSSLSKIKKEVLKIVRKIKANKK